MSKPIIKATCAAGCLWETVHKSDFLASAAYIREPITDGKLSLSEGSRTFKVRNTAASIVTGWGFTIEAVLLIQVNGNLTTFKRALELPTFDRFSDGVKIRFCGFEMMEYGDVHRADFHADLNGERKIISITVAGIYNVVTNPLPAIVVSGIDDCVSLNEEAKIFAEEGKSVFVRYSANADGSNFTENRTEGQNYMGVATAHELPTDPAAYEWLPIFTEVGDIESALDSIITIQNDLIGGASE